MNNELGVFDKLLFRGMLPFQLVQYKYTDDFLLIEQLEQPNYYIRKQPTTLNNDIKNVFKIGNSKYFKLNENDKDKIRPKKQMTVLSPLVLLPFKSAKNKMILLISKCILSYTQNQYLSELIANIISQYIFVDYYQFYDINKINEI